MKLFMSFVIILSLYNPLCAMKEEEKKEESAGMLCILASWVAETGRFLINQLPGTSSPEKEVIRAFENGTFNQTKTLEDSVNKTHMLNKVTTNLMKTSGKEYLQIIALNMPVLSKDLLPNYAILIAMQNYFKEHKNEKLIQTQQAIVEAMKELKLLQQCEDSIGKVINQSSVENKDFADQEKLLKIIMAANPEVIVRKLSEDKEFSDRIISAGSFSYIPKASGALPLQAQLAVANGQ